jgi:hypothetical protein
VGKGTPNTPFEDRLGQDLRKRISVSPTAVEHDRIAALEDKVALVKR